MERTRLMEESLWSQQFALQEKERELSMLTKWKQGLLDKEAAMKKLIDDFMVNFIGAFENNQLENAQNFDEKAMMNSIVTVINRNGGFNGGVNGDYGDYNVSGIGLDLETQATMDAIIAMVNSQESSGGDNGGFAEDHGGTNNDPESYQNLGALGGKNSDGDDGDDAAGYGGTGEGNQRKYGDDGSL
ncbi:hypothetical protein REPUB_Repub06bG0057600 [Reevesia pubescens]